VAKLLALMPKLRRLQQQRASADASIQASATQETQSFFHDPNAHAFTQGLPLNEWLDNVAWVDPLTSSPLPPPSQTPRMALATSGGASIAAAAANSVSSTSSEPGTESEATAEVTPDTLLPFLEHIAWSWLGEGVALQVGAFRDGLGDIVELNGPGVGLAFDAREQRDLFCGPDTVDWSEQSLRKTLRPTGGLKEDENTMVTKD